jgi:hypothetical protein
MIRVSAQVQLVVQSIFTTSSKTVGERRSRPAPRRPPSEIGEAAPLALGLELLEAAPEGAEVEIQRQGGAELGPRLRGLRRLEPPGGREAQRQAAAWPVPLGQLRQRHPASGEEQRPQEHLAPPVPGPGRQVVPAVAADHELEVEGGGYLHAAAPPHPAAPGGAVSSREEAAW